MQINLVRWILPLCWLSSTVFAEIIQCNISKNVRINDWTRQFKIIASVLNVSISVDKFQIQMYNDSRIVNVFAEKVQVNFSGLAYNVREKIAVVYVQSMKAYAESILHDFGVYKTTHWHVLLLPFDNYPHKQNTLFRNDVRRLAEQCLEKILPEKLTITDKNHNNSGSINNKCLPPVRYNYAMADSSLPTVQPLFNKFIDLILEEGKRRFLDDVNGEVPLPDADFTNTINKHIFITVDRFVVYWGKLYDMRDLQRTGDADIFKIGDKYFFMCTLSWRLVRLTYKHATSIVNARFYGDLNITVAPVSFSIGASFDDSVKPCILKVESLSVTKIGAVGVVINGFSPLNGLAEDTADNAADAVKLSMGELMVEDIKQLGQKLLDTLDCEKLGIAHV